jgi:hypothetical protein
VQSPGYSAAGASERLLPEREYDNAVNVASVNTSPFHSTFLLFFVVWRPQRLPSRNPRFFGVHRESGKIHGTKNLGGQFRNFGAENLFAIDSSIHLILTRAATIEMTSEASPTRKRPAAEEDTAAKAQTPEVPPDLCDVGGSEALP